MKDISTVGAVITIKGGVHIDGLVINEFSDEGTPFDSPDVDLSDHRKNLNGEMVSSRVAAVYPLSITVIPGSIADKRLYKHYRAASLHVGNVAPIGDLKIQSIVISIPDIDASGAGGASRVYQWSNIRMKGGPTGPSSSAEGRQSARTYTFEAQDLA